MASSMWVLDHADSVAQGWEDNCQVLIDFGHGSTEATPPVDGIAPENKVDQVRAHLGAQSKVAL
jgi:hypothetical protein